MPIDNRLREPHTDQLFQAILSLETLDECYQFFEDVCTVSELKAITQRLEVAKMLKEGRTYDQVIAQTRASTATISRVKRCLNYGADGYHLVLERLAAMDLEKE